MTTAFRAARIRTSSLPIKSASRLCHDYLFSFCRHGDQCPRSHEICLVEGSVPGKQCPSTSSINTLRLEDRLSSDHAEAYLDGPGSLSQFGPRHDNDHVYIKDVRILPTVDEILSLRLPHIPRKDAPIPTDPLEQRNRLLDLCFRQLRYDSIESIIDICYHAFQHCVSDTGHLSTDEASNHVETPQNNQYFLYPDIEFMDFDTAERRGVTVSISFTCPTNLRGHELERHGRLEEGMLAALIGVDYSNDALSVVFTEIIGRRSSRIMKLRTGHERRAGVTLSFADATDNDTIQRIVYNASGLLQETFVLVEFPKVLLAGFQWCLKRLQELSKASRDFAFVSHLAGDHKDVNTLNGPPEYAVNDGFAFDLDPLSSKAHAGPRNTLRFGPSPYATEAEEEAILQKLREETTLDDGQAVALCRSLSRRMAFTQGPPGTGKSYLGVSLTKVLLASRPLHDPRPVLVVCMTNHALDSFLDDLRNQGICKLARLGRGSREDWTQGYDLFTLARRTRLSTNERERAKLASARCESIYAELMAITPCIVSDTACPNRTKFLDDTGVTQGYHRKMETYPLMAVCNKLIGGDEDSRVNQPPDTIDNPNGEEEKDVQQVGVADNVHGKTTWIAIRDHLASHHPLIYNTFAQIECSRDDGLSTARLSRKASGFAFEFWLEGGDLKDIQSLLEHFDSILGRNKLPLGHLSRDRYDTLRERLTNTIVSNAQLASLAWSESPEEGDIWSMSLEKRRALAQEWREAIGPFTIPDKALELHRRYLAAVSDRRDIRRSIDMRCLLKQDVIGVTTTGCAREWDLLDGLNLQTVICEEAGEVMEAQTLCTLFPTIEHAIFIGDPQQLRPQVTQQLMSLESSSTYRLDESLFERITMPNGNKVPLAMSRLNIQRRMHPEISELLRRTLYPTLKDHPSTMTRPKVAGMAHRVYWFDHHQPEDAISGKSCSNAFEVEMTCALVEYLVNTNEYSFGDIAVLTPYNGQLIALQRRLTRTCRVWLSQADKEILEKMGILLPGQVDSPGKTEFSMSTMLRLATIDNFQGEEAKIVILSTVRSNATERVGFLKTSNRINVGCSRARDGFYVIGNATLMRGVQMWNEIISLLEERSMIGQTFKLQCHRHPFMSQHISSPEQFAQVVKCQAKCDGTLSCGHKCDQASLCHADSLHDRMECKNPCKRTHEPCGHVCSKLCGQDCGECEVEVGRFVSLPCGHSGRRLCSDDRTKCKVKVGSQTLSCGHEIGIACYQGGSETSPSCSILCDRALPCGRHRCQATCHTGDCPPCDAACVMSCEHGRCTRGCGVLCKPCLRPSNRQCLHVEFQSMPCALMSCLPPCSECESREAQEPKLQLVDVVDLVIAFIGQRMQALEQEVHYGELEMAQSRREFRYAISNSPLTGAINERRIRERTSIFDKVWEHIDEFMSKSFRNYLNPSANFDNVYR